MPRVVFVVNDAPFFLSHRLQLALGVQAAGYDVHVATPEHARVHEIRSAGLPFHPIPLLRGTAGAVSDMRGALGLARLYRWLRPDIVHHVAHKPIILGSLAARWVGAPAVVNAISGLGYAFLAEGPKAALRRRLILAGYRAAFNHRRAIGIFQNPDDVRLFVGRGILRREQYVIVPGSGVDLTAFRDTPEPPGPPRVVLPARMLWDKGVGEFVEAIRQLRASGLSLRADLVGDTDLANPAAVPIDRLRSWTEEGVVQWLGHQTDMARIYAEAHIVCLPSYREGLPKVLLEGAACGRALVATDVPGCREIAREGENAILVRARESQPLAEALARLISDRFLRVRLGRRSREIAEAEYGVERVIEATLEVYTSFLAPSRGRGITHP